jgi:serine/threonine protein kinase
MSERDIFLAAREYPDPVARAAFLDQACAGAPDLRRRVERLLRADAGTDSLLDVPAAGRPATDRSAFHANTTTPAVDETLGKSSEPALHFLGPAGRPDSLGRLGHYEVLEVLGRGGFGIVMRAYDETLQRVVAIKVLSPPLAVTSPARQRFLREARSAAAVRHENVVQVYAVEELPLPYLVMELIPGETLQQRLDRIGPLEVAEVLRIGRQIAEGLAAAHATGLIHRDIKPANVLVERRPHAPVKLTDFGLARAADDASITQSGLVVGTPLYMSPEQAQGEPLDHRSDLFSLGSVLYAMTTGRAPFRAANTLAVMRRVAEDTPRPIPDLIPEAPPWLCQLIGRLHAKDREARFQSAQEVADLLGRCLAKWLQPKSSPDLVLSADPHKPGPGGPATVAVPAGRSCRRPRRRFGWLAAAAVLLLLAGLGLTEATGVTGLLVRVTRNGKQVVRISRQSPPVLKGDYALVFDGATSHVEIPSLSRDEDGPLTIEAFVTVAGTQGAALVRIEGQYPCQMHGWPGRQAATQWVPNGLDHRGVKMNAANTPPLTPGHRAHVAFQMDGQSLHLFIDGRKVNSATRTTTPGIGVRRGTILGGQMNGQITHRFSGQLDEVRISKTLRYDGEFTPQQRLTPDKDTLALYHCDEGAGEELTDSSGNAHHGKVVGAKWVKVD